MDACCFAMRDYLRQQEARRARRLRHARGIFDASEIQGFEDGFSKCLCRIEAEGGDARHRREIERARDIYRAEIHEAERRAAAIIEAARQQAADRIAAEFGVDSVAAEAVRGNDPARLLDW